jgi:hypothetical protein
VEGCHLPLHNSLCLPLLPCISHFPPPFLAHLAAQQALGLAGRRLPSGERCQSMLTGHVPSSRTLLAWKMAAACCASILATTTVDGRIGQSFHFGLCTCSHVEMSVLRRSGSCSFSAQNCCTARLASLLDAPAASGRPRKTISLVGAAGGQGARGGDVRRRHALQLAGVLPLCGILWQLPPAACSAPHRGFQCPAQPGNLLNGFSQLASVRSACLLPLSGQVGPCSPLLGTAPDRASAARVITGVPAVPGREWEVLGSCSDLMAAAGAATATPSVSLNTALERNRQACVAAESGLLGVCPFRHALAFALARSHCPPSGALHFAV